jgi:hypothetical protein
MVQVLHTIKMKGGVVELLATPALFGIAQRKGMTIEADSKNVSEVYSAYTKLIYLAALNAWEVRRYDNPSMGECQYKLMDFVEWASMNPDAFVKAIDFILSALTGKELKDYATEGAKASETAGKPANEQGEGEEVKKKSRYGLIMRLFRRS